MIFHVQLSIILMQMQMQVLQHQFNINQSSIFYKHKNIFNLPLPSKYVPTIIYNAT